MIETYAASERSGSTLAGTRTASRRSNVKGRATGWWRRSFWPPVHGVSRSNAAELLRFSPRRWIAEFSRAGFDVAAVVTRLPVHSPYRFGWERARRFLESLGATSSIGYVVVKAGEHPDGVRWLRPQHEGAAP